MPLDRLIESRRDRGSAGFVRFLPVALMVHGVVVGALFVHDRQQARLPRTPPLRVTFQEPAPPVSPPPTAAALKPTARPSPPKLTAPAMPPVVEPAIPQQPADAGETVQGTLDRSRNPTGVASAAPDEMGGAPGLQSPPIGPVRVGGDVTAPGIRQVLPEYPPLARSAHVEGDVILEVIIRSDGTLGEIRVLRTLRLGCTQAAIQALRRWRFTPGMRNGVPVDVIMELTVTFQLE